MGRRKALILGLLGMATTSVFAQDTAIPSSEVLEEAAPDPAPELKALAETCTARKFETIVVVEGRRRGSKVKICGKEGQSEADWLVTLRDSVAKTEVDPAMAPALRDQIVSALKAEIARLEAAPAATAAVPGPALDVQLVGMTDEVVAAAEAGPQYSLVPPLPAPLPRAKQVTAAAGATAAAVAAPVVRPRLTIRCALPRETFAGCASLERETQLMIRANEDIAPRTSLRFLRGGDTRAELEIGTLRKGESRREKLPGRICSGVLRGKVQIQVLNAGKVAETLGPYALYCGS